MIPDAGHWLMEEQSAATFAAFLARPRRAPAAVKTGVRCVWQRYYLTTMTDQPKSLESID